MIIKVISRERKQDESAIKRMIRYVRAEREQDADDGKCLSGYGGSTFGAAEDEGDVQLRHMLELARSNPGCQLPMFHVMISWDGGRQPTPEQVRQAVAVWMHEVGADGLDALWAVHGNTENAHCHLLVCLIDPITSKVRDLGMWKCKSQRAKARIIGLQGLALCKDDLYLPAANGSIAVNPDAKHWQGTGSDILDAPPPLQDKKEEALAKARATVLPALEQAKTWAEFHEELVKAGVGMRRSGPGIVFVVDGTEVKGSKVSKRKCALKALEKTFGAPYAEGPATALPAPEDADGVVRNPDAKFWRGRNLESDGPEMLPALTPEAQSIEQRHGFRSAQRLAQDAVPVALERAAVSGGGWQAFHKALAEDGITVRLAGTGLVYVVGGVEVRASHVSRRTCTKAGLEEALGSFKPAPDAVLKQVETVVAGRVPAPVDGMPEDLVPWWEDYTQAREAWLAEERRLTESLQAERRHLRERLKAELDAQLAEATSELRRARAMGGRRSLPRGAGAALRMALRERGAARGRAMRKVLTADARKARRCFPDSFGEWLALQGQATLASIWRHRGIAGPQPAPAPEEPEDFGSRPGI